MRPAVFRSYQFFIMTALPISKFIVYSDHMLVIFYFLRPTGKILRAIKSNVVPRGQLVFGKCSRVLLCHEDIGA